MEQISTPAQLPVATRAKTALGVTPEYEEQLLALAGKHKGITAITNDDGAKDCHSARMELKNARLAIEKTGKAAREDAQAFARAVIAEEKRLVGIIGPEEERLQAIQTGYERQQEAERQALERAEAERKAAIQKRIADLERVPVMVVSWPAVKLNEALGKMRAENPEEWAQEFLPLATYTHADVLAKLEGMHDAAVKAEGEAARQAEERAKLAAEQKRLDEERARLEAEQRAAREKAEAEDRARRAAIAAEEEAARKRISEAEEKARAERRAEEEKLAAERRAIEEQARKQREAEEARQREERRKQEEAEATERARLRAEQEAKDAAERREREAREAAERESRRKEQERMDAYALLRSFLDLVGESEEFAGIVNDVREFLADAQVPA